MGGRNKRASSSKPARHKFDKRLLQLARSWLHCDRPASGLGVGFRHFSCGPLITIAVYWSALSCCHRLVPFPFLFSHKRGQRTNVIRFRSAPTQSNKRHSSFDINPVSIQIAANRLDDELHVHRGGSRCCRM